MIKIEVKSTNLTPRQINIKNGQRAGQVAVFHEQEAWAHTHDQQGQPHIYPQRIVLNIDLEKGQAPYPVGDYQIAPQSIYVNRFNGLELGRLILIPAAASSTLSVKKAA